MKKKLSFGKYRGLQAISTPEGVFTIVALDHQESLVHAMNPEHPELVPHQAAVDFKIAAAAALAPRASALLTDLLFGLPFVVAARALPGQTGLLVTLEKSGYDGESTARRSSLVAGWSVEKIRRMGASAVKLLLYYHPESPTARFQEEILRQVAADCHTHDIPLVLECLSYSIKPGVAKESAEFAADKARVVIETARRLCPMGADAFKAEFPADMRYEKDEGRMLAACQELTEAAGMPWMVLSAAVDHEAFCRQVDISCRGGASGFLAGRSIWKEALPLSGSARSDFLNGEGQRRLRELSEIAGRSARPWTDWYETEAFEGWYKQY